MRSTAYPIAILLCMAACAASAEWEHCAAQKDERNRFGAHEDNYLMWNEVRDRDWSAKQEGAIRGRFSVKYTMCGTPYQRFAARAGEPVDALPQGERSQHLVDPAKDTLELFFAYTGEIDFYLGTRTSDPVVSRLNNPGLHLRIPTRRYLGTGGRDDNLIVSLEHRSNGQATEVSSAEQLQRVQLAYERGDRPYIDSIGRGSNYVGLALETTSEAKGKYVELGVKLYLQFDQDSEVRWGPDALHSRRLTDYERLRLQAALNWTRHLWFDAELKLGDKLHRTASGSLGFQFPLFGFLPAYIRYHRGPFNTLANYSQRSESIGIGLRFARY